MKINIDSKVIKGAILGSLLLTIVGIIDLIDRYKDIENIAIPNLIFFILLFLIKDKTND
tara:strand:+ start:37 stop:213 length:177 start_codon:yes stop_codon:yes gene_type:complete